MVDEPDTPRDVLAAEEFALPAPDPRLHRDEARDVLAAEAFVMPAPDPRLHQDEARDVLAAEAFVMPAPDTRLRMHSQPLTLPPDPQDPDGVDPAHDVLAAEEFAMPAPLAGAGDAPPAQTGFSRQTIIATLIALTGVAVLMSRRRASALQ